MSVRAETAISGDLEIAGIGVGGSQFELPIAKAWIQQPGSKSLIEAGIAGSMIKDLSVEKGQTVQIVISFHGNSKYRLGVTDD